MVGNSQQRYIFCKSSLTDLTTFYDKMPGFSDYETVVDMIFFDFTKAFNIVSHNTLISKLGCHRLDGWTTKLKKTQVGWLAQRVVVSGLDKELTSGVPQGSVWDTSRLICTNDWEEMMKCALIKFADDTKLGGSTNKLNVWVAIQRDLGRLEDRANKEHFESQQGRMQSPEPGKEEPLATGKAGDWGEPAQGAVL